MTEPAASRAQVPGPLQQLSVTPAPASTVTLPPKLHLPESPFMARVRVINNKLNELGIGSDKKEYNAINDQMQIMTKFPNKTEKEQRAFEHLEQEVTAKYSFLENCQIAEMLLSDIRKTQKDPQIQELKEQLKEALAVAEKTCQKNDKECTKVLDELRTLCNPILGTGLAEATSGVGLIGAGATLEIRKKVPGSTFLARLKNLIFKGKSSKKEATPKEIAKFGKGMGKYTQKLLKKAGGVYYDSPTPSAPITEKT